MIGLYSSIHYSRSVTVRAFTDAAQFAHVTAAEIEQVVDEFAEPVEVELIGSRARRLIHVRACMATVVLWAMKERHGCLCSVCLCPVKFEPTSAYVDSLRFPEGCAEGWLVVGRDEYVSGPIHPWCEAAFRLIRDLDLWDPDAFKKAWKPAFSSIKENIQAHRKSLRFYPRYLVRDGVYPDMRHSHSYEPEDVVPA